MINIMHDEYKEKYEYSTIVNGNRADSLANEDFLSTVARIMLPALITT